MRKERIDVLLVEQGLFGSRQRAQAAIMAGQVLVDDVVVDKAGTRVDEKAAIRIAGRTLPYVSRGGLKLEKAHQVFGLDFGDQVVADIGASTGGFTDFCLKNGARRVFAIDVGYGQLDWSLRQDPRVVVLERTNGRYLNRELLGELVDTVVTDVSFISLTKILPAVARILRPGGEVAALIKPQFEAGRERVGKHGVVSDPAVHREVIRQVMASARQEGLVPVGLDYSPVRGPKGNIEYLLHLVGDGDLERGLDDAVVDRVVDRAAELRG